MIQRGTWAVIFDMDGVLVNSAEAHYRAWQLLANEVDLPLDRDRFARSFGQRNADVVKLLFDETNADRAAALADRKEVIYRELIRATPPLFPGVRELIHSLHDCGAMLAIGSSGPRENVELIIDALGAKKMMSAIVNGDDVTRGKPDPQVFILCVERLGLPAHRCVVIEDAPVGIQAAKAAECKTMAVLTTHSREAFATGDSVRPDSLAESLADKSIEQLMRLVQT